LSELKEVFIDILKFHKILSHHQCFKVMERVKNAKKCSGKGRTLRTRLSDQKAL
jgi:hypothetical protein